MEDDGLDPLGHEMNHGGSHRGQGVNHGIDLNSQASAAADGFPGFRIYQNLLQRDDLPNPTRGHPAMTRRLNFGSSSAASGAGVPTGRGRGDGGAAAQQRASTVLGLPPRRAARTAGGSQRGRRPRAARNAGRGQAPSTSDNYEEEVEEDVDVLASSGSHPVSQSLRAQWSDSNNACLLELCIGQRMVGAYNGAQMSSDGYQAIVDGLFARKRLVYSKQQVRNQIGILKNTHSFYRYLQAHTGLGRNPDGSVDADSDFWMTHTEKKPYLKKLLYGPPANLELLEQLWRGLTVDGSTAFVPGDDYGENEGRDVEAADEDEFEATPRNTSNQKSKRPFASTQSTLSSPVKKSKSPMVKIVKEIAHSFKESVKVNNMVIQKCATHKEAFSVGRCQELAFECGVERTAESVYAMSKIFETEYQREFFCGPLLTPELRLSYFKKWCRDNNLE
ncbi:unnamed protein product [Urochloa decumbens]|uniref:Myb/SANT-like domain-containing protein n=1 Tax=Urochloa decumbens TaxID=240449 RepID=A0ABC8X357_9POAL